MVSGRMRARRWAAGLAVIGAVVAGAMIPSAAFATPTAVPAGPDPVSIAVTPDGSRAYVVNRAAGSVTVVDDTGAVVATIPVGGQAFAIAMSHDGAHAYVTSDIAAAVFEIDTATDTVSREIAPGFGFPSAVALSPDDQTLYVSNVTARFAAVDLTDPTDPPATAFTELGTASRGMAVTSDGALAYVALPGANAVARIDLATMTEVLPRIAVGTEPWSVTINEVRGEVYVANGSSASVSVFPLGDTTVTETIPVASGPRNIRVSPDGDRVYVAGLDSSGLTVINRANGSVDQVPGGAASEGLGVGPAGNTVLLTDASNGGQLLIYSRAAFTGPDDASVVEGSPVTFTTAVTGEMDAVRWQSSVDGGITWTDVPGATDTAYTFAPTLSQSGTMFRAVVSSIVFSDTISPVATLTVTPQPVPILPPTGADASEIVAPAAIGFTVLVVGLALVALGRRRHAQH